jgi:hypothetical protein
MSEATDRSSQPARKRASTTPRAFPRLPADRRSDALKQAPAVPSDTPKHTSSSSTFTQIREAWQARFALRCQTRARLAQRHLAASTREGGGFASPRPVNLPIPAAGVRHSLNLIDPFPAGRCRQRSRIVSLVLSTSFVWSDMSACSSARWSRPMLDGTGHHCLHGHAALFAPSHAPHPISFLNDPLLQCPARGVDKGLSSRRRPSTLFSSFCCPRSKQGVPAPCT